MKNKAVVVAMSGGVDSSVSAYLLLKNGYKVVGITFINFDKQKPDDYQFIDDAKYVAQKLGIEHYVVDIRKDFKNKIIDYFVQEYRRGRTPNPCVICNRIIKWKLFIQIADELGIEKVSTGHYSNLKYENGRYFISRGKDELKDQSYFLWNLPQEYLSRSLFPLSNMTKSEIKEIAKEIGIKTIAEKKESYDVCFIRSGDYRQFLTDYFDKYNIKLQEGNFVDENGNILGKHKGLPFYTVGQRKGLGIAAGYPLFVKSLNVEDNSITVVPREKLAVKQIEVQKVNFQKYESIDPNKIFTVRIRYKDKGAQAKVSVKDDKLIIDFLEPVYGVAPGQSAVVYEQDDLVCGGIIS